MRKTTVPNKAIMKRMAIVVPGCHDALGAKVFEASQISGSGLAGAFLDKPEVGLAPMKDRRSIWA